MSEFGVAFDRAQAAYDAQEPDGDWNCEEDGHSWNRIRADGEGNVLYRCRYCGAEDVT